MLSEDKIIALYCIVDDLLKGMHHYEDERVRVSDCEIITTAFVSVLYFGGHLDNGCPFMKLKGYVPHMLSKSRFSRRLHRLSDFLVALFYGLGKQFKDMAGATTYRLDSFPVAVCDTIGISRSRILQGEVFRGKHAAMRRYFYGVRVQVLMLEGIPVEFCLVPGSESDVRALGKLPLDVAPQSCIYMDAGYTDYLSEEDLFAAAGVYAKVQRKSNSKRKDEPHERFLKEYMRKEIETDFSQIKAKMLRSIHAVTQQGFLLKVALFVIAFAFEKIA
ncbi:MAG: IS982 family transposase [Nitrososphaera sp.]|nr:IS982 family transposase [Nitrososphaera sp.]